VPAPFSMLEGGTDAGSMLLFDPAALPHDYDSQMRDDPMAVIEPLAADGRIYWLDTQADGGYDLGVYLADELPPNYKKFARQLGVAERFAVTSGKLYFTGIEYVFRDDDTFLRKHPHMGSSQDVTPGVYHLTLYDMEYPEDFHEDLLRQRIPARQFRAWSLMNLLVPLGCTSTLATLVSPFLLGRRMWVRIALPLWLALTLPAILLSRSHSYRAAVETQRAIEREYPGYFAVLRSLEA
jgi:hypothetical protein